jgi:hypothetical protein
MAFSDYAPPRRSRRRRNIAVIITVMLVVGVLALAVRYRTERRESIDYLEAAEEVAIAHSAMAERLGTALQGLGEEDRPALIQRLESLAAEANEARRTLGAAVVTRPVAAVSGLMTVAVHSWDDGIAALDDAIIAVLDAEEGDLSGEDELEAAFDLLRLGDRGYVSVLEEVSRLDPEIVPAPFPEVSYVEGAYAALYDATVIAERLRRFSGSLSQVSDVALIAATIPEPVSEGVGGVFAIPASDSFVVEVTVSNTGNVVVERVSVVVSLQKAASSEQIPPLGIVIPSIEPGASETLRFTDFDPEPGVVYTVTAVATLEEGVVDGQLDDNSWSLIFERNPE